MGPLRSIAARSEFIFHNHNGLVADQGRYLIIRTPDNPTYYWGNYLLFDQPPAPGQSLEWIALFKDAFAGSPQVRHMTFSWDNTNGTLGASDEFLEAGFEINIDIGMIADSLIQPRNPLVEIDIRPLESSSEWEDAIELQVLCRPEKFAIDPYRQFKRAAFRNYRKLVDKGLGDWWGAFRGNELVADLGLFFDSASGLARYQTVETHPKYRRKGVCAKLVFEAGRAALASGNAKTLVMIADETGDAKRVYQSVGFEPREKVVELCRMPPEDRS